MSADADAGSCICLWSPDDRCVGGNRLAQALCEVSSRSIETASGSALQRPHGLWDYDFRARRSDGRDDRRKPRKIIGQPSKQGWLYTFDRSPASDLADRRKAVRNPNSRREVVADAALPHHTTDVSRNYLAKTM